MKFNKKTLIIIGIILLVILIAMGIFLIKVNNQKKLENELEETTLEYYNKEFVEVMPYLLKRNRTLQITLKTLKQLDKDISLFEKNECDLENTYVMLTYNEKTQYDIETHLDCK